MIYGTYDIMKMYIVNTITHYYVHHSEKIKSIDSKSKSIKEIWMYKFKYYLPKLEFSQNVEFYSEGHWSMI